MDEWKKVKEADNDQYIKFESGDIVTVTVLDTPTRRDFENDEGKKVESYDMPVEVDGEERIIGLSSKRLRRTLADLDDVAPIVGQTFKIKANGEGYQRTYSVLPVGDKRKSFKPVPEKPAKKTKARGRKKKAS